MNDDDQAASSLGERLLDGVRNLWRETSRLDKVNYHHGQEIEALRARMTALESAVRGLKSLSGQGRGQERPPAKLAERSREHARRHQVSVVISGRAPPHVGGCNRQRGPPPEPNKSDPGSPSEV